MLKKKKIKKENDQPEKKISILVVDDDEIFRNFAEELLKDKYKLDFALNGKIGVDKVLSHHYDIVLMDLQMPELDGIEAITKIWEVKPDQLIIIVSGLTYDNDYIRRSKKLKNVFDVINLSLIHI